MSKRFNIYDEYREKFYRLPKVFFTNAKYKKMSNDAKMAWAILRDRLDLSQKNNWIDNNGDYYFMYSNKKLGAILCFSEPTVIKLKKELISAGLFEQVRIGLNKSNVLYLNKPDITEKDIYYIDKQENGDEPSHDEELKKFKHRNLKKLRSRTKNIEGQDLKEFESSDTESSDTELRTDDDEKNTRACAREKFTQLTDQYPHLKPLFDYLKREMLDPYIVQDIMTEMLDQHILDYRLIDVRNQLDYMKNQIGQGESYTYFGRFFVNGLKKRSQTALDVEYEHDMAQKKQAQRDTSIYYDWLHDGLDPEI